MEVYEIVKSIGSGSFGQVYLVRHKREENFKPNKKSTKNDFLDYTFSPLLKFLNVLNLGNLRL